MEARVIDARIIIDRPRIGPLNMGIDEALLRRAADGEPGSMPTIRFYQWSQPTLSLGYFQKADDRRLHAESGACDLVRRSTGGGAILHDRELTYSFITRLGPGIRFAAADYYQIFHQTLIETLAHWSVAATRCQSPPRRPASEEPFLCFARRAENDILIGDHKVVGSAQRRSREALLQHGSILLAQSPAAPQLAGIAELSGAAIGIAELIQRWSPTLCAALDLQPQRVELTAEELQEGTEIATNKFAASSWTTKR